MTSAATKFRLGLALYLLARVTAPLCASPVDQYRDASYYVTTGSVVGLTLLIDFPDDQATTNYNAAAVNNMLTQTGFKGFGGYGSTALGSMRDYFRLASNNRFDFIGTVFAFSTNYNNGGGSNGFYRAPLPKANYGAGHETAFFGVISNALAAVQAQGFNFNTLTTNSHGTVVGMTVLYASTNNAVFGPAWQALDWSPPTNGSTPFFTATNGASFRWYAVCTVCQASPPYPQINATSHECSHMLTGWTDMDGRTQTGNGNGPFCVMSSGGGSNNQYPPLPSAYLRATLGWIDIIDIVSNTPPTETLLTSARSTCYRYRNPANTNEYFLAELRDAGDAGSSGYGLAVWHVDEASPFLSGYYGTSNTPSKHCACQLLQADNRMDLENARNTGSVDDLYFSPNANRFDDYSSPSAHWWNGADSGFAISQISSRAPALRLTINPLVLNANGILHGLTNTPFVYLLQTRPGTTCTLTATNLPPGLALSGSTITGTPVSVGASTVVLTADAGNARYNYALTIKIAGNAAPLIDSPLNIAIPLYGNYLHYDITASGATPMTYSHTNGPTPSHNTLLPGWTFSNGTFSGAPTTGNGLFTNNLTLIASNSFGADTQTLNIAINVCGLPGITNTAALPTTGRVSTAYNFAFAYPDAVVPVFAVTSGALPDGLALSYDGLISGTPTATGTYTGVISAGNVSTSVFTRTFSIAIAPPITYVLTVDTAGHGQSSLGGALAHATASLLQSASTQIIYTAADWHRILSLTSNNVSVGAASGTRVYTQSLTAITASISNQVSFALAQTNQTGFPIVPVSWLTNWPEDSLLADANFDVPTKYLLGLSPATSNTYALQVESLAVAASNVVTIIKRLYSGNLSPDGMHGYLTLQAASNLGSAFTNLINTEVTGATVFDAFEQKTYTNAISTSNLFLRAVIHR